MWPAASSSLLLLWCDGLWARMNPFSHKSLLWENSLSWFETALIIWHPHHSHSTKMSESRSSPVWHYFWEDMNKYLFNSDTDQSNNIAKVQLGEPMNLLGLWSMRETWLTGHGRLKGSCIARRPPQHWWLELELSAWAPSNWTGEMTLPSSSAALCLLISPSWLYKLGEGSALCI